MNRRDKTEMHAMKKWRSVAVPPDSPLETVILALEKGGLGIVLVTDIDDVLLGTVTDGDVRRALLRRRTMDTPVREIMCATPQVADLNWSREKLLEVMDSRRLLQLPLVDAGRRVVGIETLHDMLGHRRVDIGPKSAARAYRRTRKTLAATEAAHERALREFLM
jgi:CBS domain-containing protein